jgi:uncharacterized tellurite resistance protein B-like protein
MKQEDFRKVLFKSAVSVMAVDGEIHEDEISEIKSIATSTAYFLDFEFESDLNDIISDIRKRGKESINDLLGQLGVANLNPTQEIILMEVLIRMVEADNKIDPSEIKFLNLVRATLKTTEEELITKFPKQINYLLDKANYGTGGSFDNEINIK